MNIIRNDFNKICSVAEDLYLSGKEIVKTKIDELPHNTAEKAIIGSLISFSVVMLCTGNAPLALTLAGCAAVATVIDGLLTPFFNSIFHGESSSSWTMKSLRNGISMIAAGTLVSTVVGTPIPMVTSVALMVGLNYFNRSAGHSGASTLNFV